VSEDKHITVRLSSHIVNFGVWNELLRGADAKWLKAYKVADKRIQCIKIL